MDFFTIRRIMKKFKDEDEDEAVHEMWKKIQEEFNKIDAIIDFLWEKLVDYIEDYD